MYSNKIFMKSNSLLRPVGKLISVENKFINNYIWHFNTGMSKRQTLSFSDQRPIVAHIDKHNSSSSISNIHINTIRIHAVIAKSGSIKTALSTNCKHLLYCTVRIRDIQMTLSQQFTKKLNQCLDHFYTQLDYI